MAESTQVLQSTNRREFLKATAASGAVVGSGFWIASSAEAARSKMANGQIQFGCIGVGGKGSSDSRDAGSRGEVVGICDVDRRTLQAAGKRFREAQAFTDYREMLEKLGDKIDAVTVSTPDHTHAVASSMAMKMGKHCFTQKPLTHSVYEARYLADLAREKGLATQMGNQGTAGSGLRKAAALVQAGVLGDLQEVHVWTNRPVWPQGGVRAKPEPVPEHLAWDQWLGPAPKRPYAKGYHTFSWRGWWDFGTGALGDMACHTFNMPFMAVRLRDPSTIQATTSGHNGDSYPKWSIINFEFPATSQRPAVKVLWYDGGKKPSEDLLDGRKLNKSGCIIIGSKGKLYSPGDYGGNYTLVGVQDPPEVQFPKSPGHFDEYTRAILSGNEEPAMSNFENYAGPLTETILLGNLAVWAAPEPDTPGKKIQWDAKSLVATNAPEVKKVIKPEFREGWSL